MNKGAQNHEVIKDLRKLGYRVFVNHIRNFDIESFDFEACTFELEQKPTPCGGITEVGIYLPDPCDPAKLPGIPVVYSEAICSTKDNYHRKRGVKIALGRAIDQLERKRELEQIQENAPHLEKTLVEAFSQGVTQVEANERSLPDCCRLRKESW